MESNVVTSVIGLIGTVIGALIAAVVSIVESRKHYKLEREQSSIERHIKVSELEMQKLISVRDCVIDWSDKFYKYNAIKYNNWNTQYAWDEAVLIPEEDPISLELFQAREKAFSLIGTVINDSLRSDLENFLNSDQWGIPFNPKDASRPYDDDRALFLKNRKRIISEINEEFRRQQSLYTDAN